MRQRAILFAAGAAAFAGGAAVSAGGQSRLYVNEAAPPGGDGLSWETAFQDVQAALDAAGPLTGEVWAARGTYLPSLENEPGNARSRTFDLPDGLAIYGGFAGDEDDPGERDIEANPTILSADHHGDDGPDFANRGDNSFHIVRVIGSARAATIDGFVFRGGSARSTNDESFGGGVFAQDSNILIANCAFEGNEAGTLGGAVGTIDSSITIDLCRFTGNRCITSGGAVSNLGGDLQIRGSTFEDNESLSFADGGGAVSARGPVKSITGCAFRENRAQRGGAIETFADPTVIANCDFENNSAVEFAGAIFARWTGAGVTLEDCNFTGNHCDGDGGAIVVEEASVQVHAMRCAFESNSAGDDGGVVAMQGGLATFSECTFRFNSAGDDGGAFSAPIMGSPVSEVVLADCTAEDNTAGDRGGAGYLWDTTFTCERSTFRRNSAGGQHGAFFILGDTPSPTDPVERCVVRDSVFEENTSALSNGAIGLAAEYTIERCRFERNASVQTGACTLSGTGEMIECVFVENAASYLGAATILDDALIRDCVFERNRAESNSPAGGGLAVSTEGVVSILRCAFRDNITTGPLGGGGGAGAYLFANGSGMIRAVHCTFLGNQALGAGAQGAGVFVSANGQSSCDFAGCLFNGNHADGPGGAISIGGGASNTSNCTFVHNASSVAGGAIRFAQSEMLLANSVLWDNDAPLGSEIAMSPSAGGTLTVRFSNVRGGESDIEPGGGVLDWDDASNIDLDPLFFDQDGDDDVPGNEDDDLRIFGASPSVDTGNNGDVAPDVLDLDNDGDTTEPMPFDFFRGPRIFAFGKMPIVDMGFYEFRFRLRGPE